MIWRRTEAKEDTGARVDYREEVGSLPCTKGNREGPSFGLISGHFVDASQNSLRKAIHLHQSLLVSHVQLSVRHRLQGVEHVESMAAVIEKPSDGKRWRGCPQHADPKEVARGDVERICGIQVHEACPGIVRNRCRSSR